MRRLSSIPSRPFLPSAHHSQRALIIGSASPLTPHTMSTSSPRAPLAPPPSDSQSPNGPHGPIKLTTHSQYASTRLLPSHLPSDPLTLFREWFASALATVKEPEAMTVSSVSASGVPSARTVLLKTVDHGFVFFTNYESRKSLELANGHAAGCLYWREVSRQVRFVGPVHKVSRGETEEYFRTRPRGSQLGAWASPQSGVIGEHELEGRVKEVEGTFEGEDILAPEFWGGWRVVPLSVTRTPSSLLPRWTRTADKADN